MVFAFGLFVVVGLFLMVVPAAGLGLAVGLVTAQLSMRVRALLIVGAAAASAIAWVLVLRHGYLVSIAASLAAVSALAAGGLTLLWSATRRRRSVDPWQLYGVG